MQSMKCMFVIMPLIQVSSVMRLFLFLHVWIEEFLCEYIVLSLQSWWAILVFSGNFICVSDLGFGGVGNWKYYGIITQSGDA
jgi:hypothetical protein